MRSPRFLRPAAAAALAAASLGAGAAAETYRGLCDASAAVALDDRHFAVASDEDDTLRIYRRGHPEVLAEQPLGPFFGHRGRAESDLEGGARIGERIYWIGSLGRDGKGREAPQRDRFFATDIDRSTSPPSLRPVGPGPVRLRDALLASAAGQAWNLPAAAQKAPEAAGGLNVEGLGATADGRLLIGLRNPLRNGQALLVPLLNAPQVVEGAAPVFGPPLPVALGGRGVRAIAHTDDGLRIVAGPTADVGDFALFRWTGRSADAPVPVAGIDFGTLRPEALFAWPTGVLQALSDDGGITTGGVACKDRPRRDQAFRSIDLPR